MNGYIRLLSLISLMVISNFSHAETTLVAVAANFTKPMTEIAELFQKETGHTAKLSFGSSGKLVAQIKNAAPFDVFLSADEKNPARLIKDDLAIADSRFTYAIGKLVLWSAKADLVDAQGEILNKNSFKHIALPDSKLAPYGEAAIEVLKNKNLLNKLQPLFVLGENINQTHQFISTGNAELGFISLSQVMENGKISAGSTWQVPDNLYNPIHQDAMLLKKGSENPAAIALLSFLKSAKAQAIISQYGYGLSH